MRLVFLLAVLSLFAATTGAQTKAITQEEYDRVFNYAVSVTNSQFPFVATFLSEYYENGKLVEQSLHVSERQALGIERQKFSTTEKGKTTTTYQLRTGFGDNVYCSTDGNSWTGPQKYECPRSIRVYRPRTPTSVDYSVVERTIEGKKIREYRKFEVFETDDKAPEFVEEIALIGSDGLFISTVRTMGDLKSKRIDTRLTSTWKINAKIDPIIVPKKLTPIDEVDKKSSTMTITGNQL